MNLGAALAAGGIALNSTNDYTRQANEDTARLQAQDLATQRARIVNEGLGQEVTEKGRLAKEAAADRKTEAEFAAARGKRLFNNASVPPPAANGVAGNVDLSNRPVVKNPDGSISTVSSKSFNFDGKETLLPTISDDGRRLSDEETIAQFKATGKHLGQFDTPEQATAAAQQISAAQGQRYGAGGPVGGIQGAQPMGGKGKAPGAPPSELDDYRDLYEIARKNGSNKGMRTAIEGVAQVAQAKFKMGLEEARIAWGTGDAQPLMNLYNNRYPNGRKILAIEQTPEGGALITRAGPDGKPTQVKQSPEELQRTIAGWDDPAAWAKMAEEAFKQGHMTKRELAVEARKGENDLAKQAAADLAAGQRSAATNAAGLAGHGIAAGATIKAAEIRAATDRSTVKEGSVQQRITVSYDVIDKELRSGPMGELTGENQRLIGPAKRLVHKYLDQDLPPAIAAEKAMIEARAEVKVGGMKVPVPAAGGASASGKINTGTYGY